MRSYYLSAVLTLSLTACGNSNSGSSSTGNALPNLPPQPPAPVAFQNDRDEGGFYKLNSTDVPTGLQQDAASIFLILVPQRPGATDVGGFQLRFSELMASSNASVLQKAYHQLLADCKNKVGLFSWGQTCKVSQSFEQGTAFLAGDGLTLWTAAHVMVNGIGMDKDGADRPFFVFDLNGNLVFDSSTEGADSSLKTVSPLAAQMVGASEDDYVKITLPSSLGIPLAIATHMPQVNERVYTIGYPGCTNCELAGFAAGDHRDRGGALNSPGNSLLLSQGKMADATYASQFNSTRAGLGERLFATTVDTVGGNSGGPILNSAGEVIGLVSFVGFKDGNSFINRLLVGVIPGEFQIIR